MRQPITSACKGLIGYGRTGQEISQRPLLSLSIVGRIAIKQSISIKSVVS